MQKLCPDVGGPGTSLPVSVASSSSKAGLLIEDSFLSCGGWFLNIQWDLLPNTRIGL